LTIRVLPFVSWTQARITAASARDDTTVNTNAIRPIAKVSAK
jgi:hypothetical protein